VRQHTDAQKPAKITASRGRRGRVVTVITVYGFLMCVNAKMFLERDQDCGFQSDTIPDMQEVECRPSADREFYASRTSNAYVIKSQLEALLGSIKHLSQEKSAAKTLLSRANITSLCSFTFDPAALDMLTTDPTRSRSQPSLALNLFLNVPHSFHSRYSMKNSSF
jgi:hypothetical protein